MKINVLCVGSIKESYFTNACNEYLKRLKKFYDISIFEVNEEKLPKNFSEADIANVQVKESLRLEKLFKGFVIVLDINGKMFDSVGFSNEIEKIKLTNGIITFVVGGSYGLCDIIKSKANMLLSFSKFTFPHQLMRVNLLEQIYRATTISNNITYHK